MHNTIFFLKNKYFSGHLDALLICISIFRTQYHILVWKNDFHLRFQISKMSELFYKASNWNKKCIRNMFKITRLIWIANQNRAMILRGHSLTTWTEFLVFLILLCLYYICLFYLVSLTFSLPPHPLLVNVLSLWTAP